MITAILLTTFILSAISYSINVEFDIASPTYELLESDYWPHSKQNMDDFLPIAVQRILDFGPEYWESANQAKDDFLQVVIHEVLDSDYWSHTKQDRTNFLREVAYPVLIEHFDWNAKIIGDNIVKSTIYAKNFDKLATMANMVFGTTTLVSHTLENVAQYNSGKLLLSAILLQDNKMVIIGEYKFYSSDNTGTNRELLKTVTFNTNIIERNINLKKIIIMCEDDLWDICSGSLIFDPKKKIAFKFNFNDDYYLGEEPADYLFDPIC